MTSKLIRLKQNYYSYLDRKARHIAYKLTKREKVTKLILDYIKELYDSEKSYIRVIKADIKKGEFQTAYHNPISSELEFLIARTLFHYSNFNELNWVIYLRKQYKKTAPDIRIERNNVVIAIIEAKAKAGWIQPFFSKERYNKDLIRLKEGKGKYNPDDLIEKVRNQFKKYYEVYNINPHRVFVFLPTLESVHRKGYKSTIEDYRYQFAENSGLLKNNLILLSKNLSLDLSSNPRRAEYDPTDDFENFVYGLNKK